MMVEIMEVTLLIRLMMDMVLLMKMKTIAYNFDHLLQMLMIFIYKKWSKYIRRTYVLIVNQMIISTIL